MALFFPSTTTNPSLDKKSSTKYDPRLIAKLRDIFELWIQSHRGVDHRILFVRIDRLSFFAKWIQSHKGVDLHILFAHGTYDGLILASIPRVLEMFFEMCIQTQHLKRIERNIFFSKDGRILPFVEETPLFDPWSRARSWATPWSCIEPLFIYVPINVDAILFCLPGIQDSMASFSVDMGHSTDQLYQSQVAESAVLHCMLFSPAQQPLIINLVNPARMNQKLEYVLSMT
ncbi:hypothetical protein EG329_009491 [Mollisiaceae sp. DMI_Dod_QoI]|nr:hypothetical protein EG329_009491 [Helotiales sp. DMI_Dod_QoI]